MAVEANKTYIGIVQKNDDPKKLGRVKIRVVGVYDEMKIEDIPWASPWKDLNGNGFNLPEIGKLLTVIFDNGNEYKPEYIYSDFYNINLEKKLQSLEGSNYVSMKSLIFDHKTQIYVNDVEGLKFDYKFNNINITEKEINLNLKDNFGRINIGDSHPDQQSILGTNFLNWFDKFIEELMCLNGPPYLVNVPISPSPEFLAICQQYKALKYPKFLSDNIYMNDNTAITSIKNDTSTDPNLRINDSQVGDNIKTNVENLKTTQPQDNQDFTPKDGNGTEVPEPGDGSTGQLSTQSETNNESQSDSPPVISPQINPNIDSILAAMRKKKDSKGNYYKIVEKPYYINLVSIRTQRQGQPYSNKFKDTMYAIWKDDKGSWQSAKWAISTIPGLYKSFGKKIKMKAHMKTNRPQGLGILTEGQYLNIYKLSEGNPASDSSFKKIPHFISVGNQTAYRDKNWESDIITYSNLGKLDVANHGMFIHKGFGGGVNVNNWSEGCQVFSNQKDFEQLISLSRYHVKKHGNSFNYTLLLDTDLA